MQEHKDYEIDFSELNCLEHQSLCQEIGITVYPSLYLFKNGKVFYHSGEMTEEGLRQFFRGGWESMEGFILG